MAMKAILVQNAVCRFRRNFLQLSRAFCDGKKGSEPSSLVGSDHLFAETPQDARTKQAFQTAIGLFLHRNIQRKGHVDFMKVALKYMKEYGVHKDLESYKKLMDLFPKGKMIPENMIQADTLYYPQQQTVALDILDEMDFYRVYPDREMYHIVRNTFGDWTHVARKMKRMMYWLPKFRYIDPYEVPRPPPQDGLELAKLAVRIMCRDPANKISVISASDETTESQTAWVVSGQSLHQSDLIAKHSEKKPMFVDGPSIVWVDNKQVKYFVLLTDPEPGLLHETFEKSTDDETPEFWKNWETRHSTEFPECRKALWKDPTIHEQADGTIFGICATETSTKESLAAWVDFLVGLNPRMATVPVLFRMRTPEAALVATAEEQHH